ncbi:MAG TPA: NADH-quinone oxidoreductase subunit N [Polyangia bacterium]
METTLDNLNSLGAFAPELVLCAGIVAVLSVSFARWDAGRLAVGVAALTCVAAVVAAIVTAPASPQRLFGGLLARDPFADFFKLLLPASGALICGLTLHAREEAGAAGRATTTARDREAPEFFALLLAVILGAQLMAAANNLLMLYLALELSSLASYALAGFSRRSRRSSEAALKYVVYGGVASGVMVYGLSLLYGLASSLEFSRVQAALIDAPAPVALLATGLCLAGLGFKVAAVPFHSWCPDVYEGAPVTVAAFLSIVPKAGGFALLLRLFANPEGPNVGGALSFGAVPWPMLALVLAAASMTLGNLAALAQRNVKRLLAYSSIAHAGYLFLGLAAGPVGHKAILFYLGAYLFATVAAFGVLIAVIERQPPGAASAAAAEDLSAWAGLSRRSPFLAFVMTVTLFSLAGLPPTAGFLGKYYLFSALVAVGRSTGEAMYFVAALLAVINTVVSLAYYLRIVRAMYLVAPPPDLAPAGSTSSSSSSSPWFLPALLGGLALATLALGVFWGPLDALAGASSTLLTSGPR